MKIRLMPAVWLVGLLATTGPLVAQTNGSDIEPAPARGTAADTSVILHPPAGGSPENRGLIVFSSNPGKTPNADYDLFLICRDGSNRKKLTSLAKFVNHPAWSPERSRIAFSANAGREDKIFLMSADGKETRQLTVGEGSDQFPTWSPDGRSVAYISRRHGVPNLFVVDIRGGDPRQLTHVTGKDTVLWPSWSPKGDVIAFTYNKAGPEIDERLHTIRPDGNGERELLSSEDPNLGDSEPAWSPDGETMYFFSNRTKHVEVWRLDYGKLAALLAAGRKFGDKDIGLRRVSDLFGANVFPNHRPRVAPDGRKIVFFGVGADWKQVGTNLYTINSDGSGLTNVTKSADGNEWPDW